MITEEHYPLGKLNSSVGFVSKFVVKYLGGSARVVGDEEEDGVDDIENEFSFDGRSRHDLQQALSADAMLHGHMSYGRASSVSSDFHNDLHPMPQLPLLTNGQMVDDIPPEQHALVPAYMGNGGGKRIHPLPFSDPAFPVQPRSMDPSKDLAAYGYGSVAWKERMESWKQKQEKLQMMKHENGGKDFNYDGNGDGPDLPLRILKRREKSWKKERRLC